MSDERINRIEERQDKQESMHNETMKNISSLVTALEVQSSKFDAIIEQHNKHDDTIEKLRGEIVTLKETQASFKPFIDIVQSINQKVWFMLLTGIASIIGLAWTLAN